MFDRLSPTINGAGCAEALKLPISPLEGEMPGRAERGTQAQCQRNFLQTH